MEAQAPLPVLKRSDNFFEKQGSDLTWVNSFTLNFNPSSAYDNQR